jgi:hypothetical protein
VQFEDCTTCDGALEVCGIQSIQSVDQVLDQHLTRQGGKPEEEEEEEVVEHKVTVLDALKGLEAG